MTITNLKVQPELLKNKAAEIQNERSAIQVCLEEMRAQVEGLKNIWESEAATAYQTKFLATKDDVELILNTVKEYSDDLITVAEVYTRAEDTAKAKAESLPTDIVY